MKAFLHGRLQAWSQLQQQASALIVRFNAAPPGTDTTLADLLDRTAIASASHGLASEQASALELRAQLTMAGRGVDPVSLERPSVHRRDLISRWTFRALMALSAQLRERLRQDEAILTGARQSLAPLLLAGIQSGAVQAAGIDLDSPTTTAISAFWRSAMADAGLGLAAKQVALLISQPDIVLLLEDLISSLSMPSPTAPLS